MKNIHKVWLYFVLGIVLMGGAYVYLDKIYFAPATDFRVVSSTDKKAQNGIDEFTFVGSADGERIYSHDKEYMALVNPESVKIYRAGKPNDAISIKLDGKKVSLFEWLDDRNLAVVALYGGETPHTVEFKQFNPEMTDHMSGTEIEKLPENSRITSIVYSTATNVIYMKVRVGEKAYRIYRTDANYDTRRIYVQATNVGRIAVLYDEDVFFYDNLRTGDIYTYTDATGSWRIINPPGRYLLIGLSDNKDIYIAKVNEKNEALAISVGRLGVGFKEELILPTPLSMDKLTVESAQKMIKEHEKK